jgi:hypothetical protein
LDQAPALEQVTVYNSGSRQYSDPNTVAYATNNKKNYQITVDLSAVDQGVTRATILNYIMNLITFAICCPEIGWSQIGVFLFHEI